MLSFRQYLSFVIACTLFLAAAIIITALPMIEYLPSFVQIGFVAAALFAAIVLVLAVSFERYAIFFTTITVAAAALLLAGETVKNAALVDFVFLAAWYILPLNFVLFAFLSETRLVSIAALLRTLFLFAEFAAIILIGFSESVNAASVLLSYEFFQPPMLIVGVPQAGLALCVAALGALGYKIVASKQKTLAIAMAFALVAALGGVWCYPLNGASWAFFCCAFATYLMGFVYLSYQMSYYDELTGILGRRALYEALDRLPAHYAIAMIDIDHFKRFNDDHGHAVGDQALRMVATVISGVRGGASAYRYGGEEFTIIFGGKNREEAAGFLEEIRAKTAASAFRKRAPDRAKTKPKKPQKPRKAEELRVTISIGVADNLSKTMTREMVMKAADTALYKAKEEGRNRVIVG